MTNGNGFRLVAILSIILLTSSCASSRKFTFQTSEPENRSVNKTNGKPPELIFTMPSSGNTLPGEDNRCSKTFSITATPPEYENHYNTMGFVVTQDGKPNENIRFDIIEENASFWWDEEFIHGVQRQVWCSPVPWGKGLYFANATGTGGKDFAVKIYLTPVGNELAVSTVRSNRGEVVYKIHGK